MILRGKGSRHKSSLPVAPLAQQWEIQTEARGARGQTITPHLSSVSNHFLFKERFYVRAFVTTCLIVHSPLLAIGRFE